MHSFSLRPGGLALFCLMLSGFLSSGLVSAQDPQQSQQNLLDNLQRESQQRQERRLDDVLLPGRDPSVQPTVPDTPDDARCFPVQRVEFVELDGEPLVRWSWLARSAESHLQQHANCLSLAGVQAMQRLLGNQLIERGFVASRILLPEQDLSEGVLHLLVVPGHLEGFSAQGLHRRQLVMAVPGKQGRPVNLRDLEQGIENLARLPGMDPRLDIAPGAEQGGTRIVADATWPRRYRASLALNEKYYGSTAHGTARAMLELGAPLTLTDRLVLSVNSDLDTAYSDKAVGGSVDYDIAVGYWLAALGFSRQEYRNDIDGIHQSFSASGTTEISRVDLGRVVYRSAATHVSLGIQGAHSDVSNLLDRATIQVSSYRLRTLGLRGEIKRLQAGMQWAVGLTTERSWADGPATRLPGGARVADPINQRWLLYLSASRPVSGGVLQGRLNGQFSNADLFASQRFSLTAHTRGYEDISVTANSAYSGGLEYSLTPRVWRGVGLRPFLALDSGIVPGASNEPGSVALSSMTAGMSAGYRRAQFTMEANRPLPDLSTERSANDYALRASLSLSY